MTRAARRSSITFLIAALLYLSGSSALFALPVNEPSHTLISEPGPQVDLRDKVARILARMEARSAARAAEAERLGITLPSQKRRPLPIDQEAGSQGMQPPIEVPATQYAAPAPSPQAQPAPAPGTAVSETRAAPAGRLATPATPEPAPASLESVTEEPTQKTLFSVPYRMVSTSKARRQAEASRLNLTLPSQGGQIDHISKAYPKITAVITEMIDRAPEAVPLNFGFYPG